jgi:hypothetical protein
MSNSDSEKFDRYMSLLDRLNAIVLNHNANIDRITRIMKFSGAVGKAVSSSSQAERQLYMLDILRLIVVMLHANMDDTLREIVRLSYARNNPDHLSEIPIGNTKSPRVTLADLVKYRGRTIDDLIQESVDDYLNIVSFNNVEITAKILSRAGININGLKRYFSCFG